MHIGSLYTTGQPERCGGQYPIPDRTTACEDTFYAYWARGWNSRHDISPQNSIDSKNNDSSSLIQFASFGRKRRNHGRNFLQRRDKRNRKRRTDIGQNKNINNRGDGASGIKNNNNAVHKNIKVPDSDVVQDGDERLLASWNFGVPTQPPMPNPKNPIFQVVFFMNLKILLFET